VYQPVFPVHADLAKEAGHGGGDFFTNYYFAEAIRAAKQPYLDVYRGVTMSIAGIQAWRSALEQGTPHDIPDLRSEEVRKMYEADDWSPDPTRDGPHRLPTTILPELTPSAEAIAFSKDVWAKQGYHGE